MCIIISFRQCNGHGASCVYTTSCGVRHLSGNRRKLLDLVNPRFSVVLHGSNHNQADNDRYEYCTQPFFEQKMVHSFVLKVSFSSSSSYITCFVTLKLVLMNVICSSSVIRPPVVSGVGQVTAMYACRPQDSIYRPNLHVSVNVMAVSLLISSTREQLLISFTRMKPSNQVGFR